MYKKLSNLIMSVFYSYRFGTSVKSVYEVLSRTSKPTSLEK